MPAKVATTRDIAEFFRLGLIGALVPQSEAIAWADSLLEKSEMPEDAVLELSISETQGRLAAIAALGAIRGVANPSLPSQLLLAWCHRLVTAGERDEFDVLSALRGLQLEDQLSNRIDALDDDRYLAKHEHYGTLAQVRTDTRHFLSQFAGYEDEIPRRGPKDCN